MRLFQMNISWTYKLSEKNNGIPTLSIFLHLTLLPPRYDFATIKETCYDAKYYTWEDSFPFQHCKDQFIRKCVPKEMESILKHCYMLEASVHFGMHKTAAKMFQYEFYWPLYLKIILNLLVHVNNVKRQEICTRNFSKQHASHWIV